MENQLFEKMKFFKKSKPQEFSRTAKFLTDNKQKKLAMIFAIGCLVFAVIAQMVTIACMSREAKVFVLDGTHTLHIGPLQEIGNSPLFKEIALVATQVIFQRSSVGLDLPELVPHLFSDPAAKTLMENIQASLPELKAKNLHQKPEVSQILSLFEKDGLRILKVQGNLISAGHFEGIPIMEAHQFKIKIGLTANPNLSEQKRYPFIVSGFNILEITPI